MAIWTFLLGCVVALVAWAHWPALSAQAFLLDDQQYLIDNPLVQNPGWTSAKRFLSEVLKPSTVAGYYQPLNMISLMLDYAMGGRPDNLYPFHRTSLILHLINTILIIILLYHLFNEPLVAVMVGLLFGLHPLTVEPIPWVGERKTLLAACFALISLIAYTRYANQRSSRKAWYGICMASYVLALLSKPTSTPLPLLLLLLDFWPLKRLNRQRVMEKIPFFLIGAGSAVITFLSQQETAGVYNPSEQSLLRIPLILCHNIIFYLYKIVWPTNLSAYYAFPDPMTLSHPMVLSGVIGTCILLVLLFVSLLRTRALLTGWLFFFVAIFPTMGVIGFTVAIAFDKYTYLPMVGILMILAHFLSRIWKKSHSNKQLGVIIAVHIIGSVEAVETRAYLTCWQDTETLNRYMLASAPRAWRLYNELGVTLSDQGRHNEAIACYVKALELNSNSVDAYNNIGLSLSHVGQTDEAIINYHKALAIDPDYLKAHNNLGLALAAQGKLDEAITHYRHAIQKNPQYMKAHLNLGTALAAQNKTDEAITHYRRALALQPEDAKTHNNLGIALAIQGQTEEAIIHFRQALKSKPNDVISHNNLANALATLGRIEEAMTHDRQVLQLKPDFADAHIHLGELLERQGRSKEAATEYREALRINPNHQVAQQHLQSILEK